MRSFSAVISMLAPVIGLARSVVGPSARNTTVASAPSLPRVSFQPWPAPSTARKLTATLLGRYSVKPTSIR